jgi:Glycosyl hydrolase family 26
MRLKLVATVTAVALALGSITASAGSASAAPATPPVVGVYQAPGNCKLQSFVKATAATPNLCLVFDSWSRKADFPSETVAAANAAGMATMISWQPWNPAKGKVAQPKFSPKVVASGKFDSYVKRWAQAAAKFSYPIYMRYAHEMNGPWYPWGYGVKGNTAAQYVKAWRHVHDIFVANGATNVVWVWAPNAITKSSKVSLKTYYPGDNYVDYVGPVGYARGDKDTFKSVFSLTFASIAKFTQKPILISETACFTKLKRQSACVADFMKSMTKNPSIVGFVWFNSASKKSAWHLSAASAKAFKTNLANFIATKAVQ